MTDGMGNTYRLGYWLMIVGILMSSLATASIGNPNNRIAEIRIAPGKRMIVMKLFSGVCREYSGPRPLASEARLLEGLSECDLDSLPKSNRCQGHYPAAFPASTPTAFGARPADR